MAFSVDMEVNGGATALIRGSTRGGGEVDSVVSELTISLDRINQVLASVNSSSLPRTRAPLTSAMPLTSDGFFPLRPACRRI